ncbi:Double zinc ribbon [compost metagenome]
MSHFFNKMKQGVSEAGKKAQNTVEAATLKIQMTSKEKEIDKNYTAIGRIVHRAILRKESMIPLTELQKYQHIITKLEQEIQHMQRKIQQIQTQKECGCGKMLPADATYCPFCGQQFHTVKVKSVPLYGHKSVGTVHCNQCGATVASTDHYCRGCGHHLMKN